jgi:hypothetical protein
MSVVLCGNVHTSVLFCNLRSGPESQGVYMNVFKEINNLLSGCRAAQKHAREMAVRNYLNGTGPGGTNTSAWFAENKSSVGSARQMHWSKSCSFPVLLPCATLLDSVRGIHKMQDPQISNSTLWQTTYHRTFGGSMP